MTWEVHQGDASELLRGQADASIDAVVTDPPYALTGASRNGSQRVNPDNAYGRARIGARGFMDKTWDAEIPGPELWAEVLRVAKPGAHIVAFGGTRTHHRLWCAIEDAGFEIRDTLFWLYGNGFPKSRNGPWGGTALKPAVEPIVLARAPLDGTLAENWTPWGTGGLGVERCRIPADGSRRLTGAARTSAGRWPANVLLDVDAAALLDEQSGVLVSGFMAAGTEREGVGYHGALGTKVRNDTHGDTGGASRFFYTSKAAASERHAAGKNTHPTVKPVDLMRWLCRLVTPKGGLILDPFCGSGSTGVAALAEGFRFIGFEREAEYVETARRRIGGPLFAELDAPTR